MAGSRNELKPIEHQAESFGRVRDAHSSEIAEDYVELIADLLDIDGDVRAINLAQRFGVTPATVNNTIKRLVRDGLVKSAHYPGFPNQVPDEPRQGRRWAPLWGFRPAPGRHFRGFRA